MAEPHDIGACERLDALRRGLYRPGSTEADLRRYLDERDAALPAAPDDDPPAPHRGRRRLLVVGAGAGLGLAVIVALSLSLAPEAPERIAAAPAPATSSQPSTGPTLVTDVGEGQTLTVRAGAVTSSVATPTSVGGTRVVGRLFEGIGNAVLPVDPPVDPLRGGSAVVLISSSSRVPVTWRALSRLRVGRATPEPLVLGRGISTEPSGAPVPQMFRFEAESGPARIAVAAPPGTRWSLLLAIAGDEDPLH